MPIRYAVSEGGATAVWAKPGEDMNAKMTAGVIDFYKIALRRTTADRASDIKAMQQAQSRPAEKPMTEEEKMALLAKIKALQEAEKARQQREILEKLEEKMEKK